MPWTGSWLYSGIFSILPTQCTLHPSGYIYYTQYLSETSMSALKFTLVFNLRKLIAVIAISLHCTIPQFLDNSQKCSTPSTHFGNSLLKYIHNHVIIYLNTYLVFLFWLSFFGSKEEQLILIALRERGRLSNLWK